KAAAVPQPPLQVVGQRLGDRLVVPVEVPEHRVHRRDLAALGDRPNEGVRNRVALATQRVQQPVRVAHVLSAPPPRDPARWYGSNGRATTTNLRGSVSSPQRNGWRDSWST